MKVKSKIRKAAWYSIIVALVLSGLVIVITQSCQIKPEQEGNVVVKFDEGYSSKTVIPGIDMEILEYVVTGDGQQNLGPFVIVKPENFLTLNVKTGNYNLYVSGRNLTDDEVGYGTESFSVQPGQVTVVSVTVKPLEGQGTFEVNVEYSPVEIIADPNIDVKIKAVQAGGFTDISSSFIYGSGVDSGFWNYSELTEIGWHMLKLKIKDGTASVHGIVETVRIIHFLIER